MTWQGLQNVALPILCGLFGLAAALCAPVTLKLSLRCPNGGAAIIALQITPFFRFQKDIYELLASGKPPQATQKKAVSVPRVKKKRAAWQNIIKKIPLAPMQSYIFRMLHSTHIQRLDLRASLGLRHEPAFTALACGTASVFFSSVLCLHPNVDWSQAHIAITPNFDRDALDFQFSCIVWARPWHIMRISFLFLKEMQRWHSTQLKQL